MAASATQLAPGADQAYLAPVVSVLEHPDGDGARWLAALTLLIEAGHRKEDGERG